MALFPYCEKYLVFFNTQDLKVTQCKQWYTNYKNVHMYAPKIMQV